MVIGCLAFCSISTQVIPMQSIRCRPFAPNGGWGQHLDLSSRSVGVLIASFLRELINNYVYGGFDSTLCSDEKIKVGKRVRVECRLSIAHVLRIFLEEGLALLSGTRYRI